jgi:hypothetical protein
LPQRPAAQPCHRRRSWAASSQAGRCTAELPQGLQLRWVCPQAWFQRCSEPEASASWQVGSGNQVDSALHHGPGPVPKGLRLGRLGDFGSPFQFQDLSQGLVVTIAIAVRRTRRQGGCRRVVLHRRLQGRHPLGGFLMAKRWVSVPRRVVRRSSPYWRSPGSLFRAPRPWVC